MLEDRRYMGNRKWLLSDVVKSGTQNPPPHVNIDTVFQVDDQRRGQLSDPSLILLVKHRIQLKKGAKAKVQNRKIRLSFKKREWLVGYLAKLEEANLIIRVREAEMSSDIPT